MKLFASYFKIYWSIFFILFIIFVPFNLFYVFQQTITNLLFKDLIQFISEKLFLNSKIRIDYSSDSYSLLILINILLVLSFLLSFLLKNAKNVISYYAKKIIIIFSSIILFKYGVDKIFHAQFYIPEANILYTSFGNLDKDILFWSTLGTSKIYNIVIGSIEILISILLIFRKTQFIGVVLAICSWFYIFILNISFDISVKIFSFCLLSMSIFVLDIKGIIQLKKLFNFNLIENRKYLPKIGAILFGLKFYIIASSMLTILLPYFVKHQDEDNIFNKVYKISNDESQFSYLFFHKNNYIIFMEKNTEKMESYYYSFQSKNRIVLESPTHKNFLLYYLINQKDSTILLTSKNFQLKGKALNWKKMNAIKDNFEFLID